MKSKRNGAQTVRTIVQISVFALVLLIVLGKTLAESGIALPFAPDVSLHAICPFGGVATLYTFATTGTFIQKIHSSSFILMGLGVVVALLFGTIFCGYVCPFGSFQEWIGKIGKKLFPKKYNRFVPKNLDRVLRYLRYVVLGLIVYQSAVTTKLIFESVDPYYALFHLFTGEVAITAYIVLITIAILSLFVERPWCKYLCPYGAFLGLFNTIRIFKIRSNKDTCIDCKQCDNVCPMNIEVSKHTVIRDPQCITCHKCTDSNICPVADTMSISIRKDGGSRED